MTEARRIDQWLWYARFFKSRSLATKFVAAGRLRVNGDLIAKAHHGLREGDVLTFPKGPDIRVVRVEALGKRRGPAPEAQTLYTDLAPPEPRQRAEDTPDRPAPAARREPGSGRPTKAERRATDRLRAQD
ncbi:MAG: RNA-binding S4 domain-containing protein [Rhodobacterales bacterium]|nr:RNA-binding S4 domain-containing protein [Rhodobacterales bacterium]